MQMLGLRISAIQVTPQDFRESYGNDAMCTICLLELEDGDRVADLDICIMPTAFGRMDIEEGVSCFYS